MSADIDALHATLEETRAKLEAALDAREAATRARNEAESAWLEARDAVRANDPIYNALMQAMDAADLDGPPHDHEDWCDRVERFRAAFARRGFVIVPKVLA